MPCAKKIIFPWKNQISLASPVITGAIIDSRTNGSHKRGNSRRFNQLRMLLPGQNCGKARIAGRMPAAAATRQMPSA